MQIELLVDKIKIYGPKVDGGYKLTFEIGEYEKDKLAELIKELYDTNYKITIQEEGPGTA
jgi:hypothetical protein